jgi:addiction module HigA family antidote
MIDGESALNGREEHPVHQMSKSLTAIRRNVVAIPAIQPGEHLAEELKELGMSAAGLARLLGVPTNRVTEILNGRRAITRDTALRLAHFFETTAEFWLNLQSLYELRIAGKRREVHQSFADAEAFRRGAAEFIRLRPRASAKARIRKMTRRKAILPPSPVFGVHPVNLQDF